MPLKHNLVRTLHGLVTISEHFAGFNLINTGVVNCLIMCQNARKMNHSDEKKSKIFWGGGTAPPQPRLLPIGGIPLSHWGGDTPSPNSSFTRSKFMEGV